MQEIDPYLEISNFIKKYLPSIKHLMAICNDPLEEKDNLIYKTSEFRNFDQFTRTLNLFDELVLDNKKYDFTSIGSLESRLNHYLVQCRAIINHHPDGYLFKKVEQDILELIGAQSSNFCLNDLEQNEKYMSKLLELGFIFHERMKALDSIRQKELPEPFANKKTSYDVYRLASKDISLILWGKTESQIICFAGDKFDLKNRYVDLNIKETAYLIQDTFNKFRSFLNFLGLYAPPFSKDGIFYQKAIRPYRLDNVVSDDGLSNDPPF